MNWKLFYWLEINGLQLSTKQTQNLCSGYTITLFELEGFLSVGKNTSPFSKGDRMRTWCWSVVFTMYILAISQIIIHSPLRIRRNELVIPCIHNSLFYIANCSMSYSFSYMQILVNNFWGTSDQSTFTLLTYRHIIDVSNSLGIGTYVKDTD